MRFSKYQNTYDGGSVDLFTTHTSRNIEPSCIIFSDSPTISAYAAVQQNKIIVRIDDMTLAIYTKKLKTKVKIVYINCSTSLDVFGFNGNSRIFLVPNKIYAGIPRDQSFFTNEKNSLVNIKNL